MEISLSQAILLAKEGRKLEAGWILEEILRLDTSNELAWLWYADCAETIDERVKILQSCLRYNPLAERARTGLQILEKAGSSSDTLSMQPDLQLPVTGQEAGQELSMAFQIPVIEDQDDFKDQAIPYPSDESPAEAQDGWELSEGGAVFTVSPETITEDEFDEIASRTEAYLNTRPELNRRRSTRAKVQDDWNDLVISTADWTPVQTEVEPSSSSRGVKTLLMALVLVAVLVILATAILLQML